MASVAEAVAVIDNEARERRGPSLAGANAWPEASMAIKATEYIIFVDS
jgi:hypothetical protein